MATSGQSPDLSPAFNAGFADVDFNQVCNGLEPLRNGSTVRFSDTEIPLDLNRVLSVQIDKFMGEAYANQLGGSGGNGDRNYGISLRRVVEDSDNYLLDVSYCEGDNSINMSFTLSMSETDMTVSSFVFDYSGYEFINGSLVSKSDETQAFIYNVTAPESLNDPWYISTVVNAVTGSILNFYPDPGSQIMLAGADEQQDIELLPEYVDLDELPGPEALAIAIQDDLTKKGFPPHTLARLLLEPLDHAQILEEHGVLVETDPRSELRAYMSRNPLFKHMAWLLRNSASVLGHLVNHINEEWARYILNFEFKDDDLLFNVTLPNRGTAILSNQQIELLVKVLKIQGFINSNGGHLLED